MSATGGDRPQQRFRSRSSAEPDPGAAQPPGKLPRRVQAGYGSVELGVVAAEILLQVYLLKFYNEVVGLPAALAGLALSLGLLWDAFTDPVMGGLSDRTRSRWGKRRPYFLPGALGLAIFFIALFHPPDTGSDVLAFLYLLFGFIGVNTAMTVLSVPHVALAGELAFDRDERTALFGYRRLFGTLGLVLGTVLPALFLRAAGGGEDPGDVARSREWTAAILAAPILLTALWAFVATRGRDTSAPRSQHDELHELSSARGESRPARQGHHAAFVAALDQAARLFLQQRDVWTNRVFLPLLLSYIVAGVGRTLNGSIALYYYEYRLQLEEDQVVLGVLLPFFLCLLASIPVWVSLSRRLGKKRSALAGVVGLGLLTVVAYPLFPAESLTAPLAAAMAGGILAGAIVILDSLIADVVDHDELKTGRDREGLYFGVWKLGTKIARALDLAAAGLFLQWVGFQEGAPSQDPTVGWRLAIVFGPVVGLFFLAAAAIFALLPMTDERHRRVQALLLRRRARAARTH